MARAIALGLVAVALAAGAAQATAPRSASQYAGLVLKKLDLSQPPSYPTEFFTPPPAPGEKGGREKLTDDVAAALRIMTDPIAPEGAWCPPINTILVLALGTNTYFDIGRTSNPALEDFRKDWLKVQQQAGCV